MFDHHEVMQRRNLIGPFFSRRAILKLEKTVQEKVTQFILDRTFVMADYQ